MAGGWRKGRLSGMIFILGILLFFIGYFYLQLSANPEDSIEFIDKESCDKRIQQLQLTVKQLRNHIEELETEKENWPKKKRQKQYSQNKKNSGTVAATTIAPSSPTTKTEENEALKDTYVGCFKDSFRERDLPMFHAIFYATIEKCQHICYALSYKYAGLQDGTECWCGNDYGTHGVSYACQKQCSGNPNEVCGGPLANSVYNSVPVNYEETNYVDAGDKWPSSSVHCVGSSSIDRICEFENLYYEEETNQFIFYLTPSSNITIFGEVLKSDKNYPNLVELSTLTPFAAMSLTVIATIPPKWKEEFSLVLQSHKTFLLHRFLPSNIMHSIHDDLLGLYKTMKMYSPLTAPTKNAAGYTYPYDLNSRILLMDQHRPYAYFELLQLMSNFLIDSRSDFLPKSIVRFEKLVAGLSKETTWYQYGFHQMQGPITNKVVDGNIVREFGEFIRQRYLDVTNLADIPNDVPPGIVMLSRTINRKITNEDLLKITLEKAFHLPVHIIRLEEQRLIYVIWAMSTAKLAIGMHGSIFILTLFMPRNSMVLEMFPYGIPDRNYTPYRTLANLPGMGLIYVSWMNKHKENTIGYPERSRLQGGIAHLTAAKQKEILGATVIPTHLCCEDPQWLYHIYQDTIVETNEIVSLIDSKLRTISG